jgi:ubiquinone/menaquinone biosynthesis C-methylase UbiE
MNALSTFDENKWDHEEHLLPRPYGTLCSLNQDHLQRYAFAKWFCQGSDVLDAAMGCGYGAMLMPARRYVGVDRDQNAVAFAREYYGRLLPHAAFEVGDVTSLPLQAESVDRYISFETIEHLPRDVLVSYFAEAKRVLRRGGLFLCSSPIYRGDRFGLASTHHTFEFRYGQLQETIGQSGFKLEEVWFQSPFVYVPSMMAPPFAWTQGVDVHMTICIARKI